MKTNLVLLILTFAPFSLCEDGLEAARESVRGDTGKWNDAAILQVAPPLATKPPSLNLDNWADQLLETTVQPRANGEIWLLFRTRQLDDNDRVWVEKVDLLGKEITVTMREAIWQGNYFKTFTYYEVLAVNLGIQTAGDYTVKWVVEPLVFKQFDGDGKPFAKNGKPQNRPKDAVPGKGEAVTVEVKFEVKP